ncbi:MAG: endonuclease III [Lentisphaerae bacterium ADurb.Bin242]|nr:MAG: endonuclease III [Lentisphaerae bacterium ADurb.Bin242]
MILQAYRILFDLYGEQRWWPCKSGRRWEIVAGAVLTQNCAWRNVEKALENLTSAGLDTPENVLRAEPETLRDAIRPAGFFQQKSVYLKETAGFFLENEKEYSRQTSENELYNRRKKLLSVKGIGRETADSILLYAFQQPVFVIDAYTRRMAGRHLKLDETLPYDKLQAVFMSALPRDVRIYNEYHALIVRLCKESCLKQRCGTVCHEIG